MKVAIRPTAFIWQQTNGKDKTITQERQEQYRVEAKGEQRVNCRERERKKQENDNIGAAVLDFT